jgi:hypothetical protein
MNRNQRESVKDAIWRMQCRMSGSGTKTLADYKAGNAAAPGSDAAAPGTSSAAAGKAPAASPVLRENTFGSHAIVKNLYEGKGSSEGYYLWVDFPPRQQMSTSAGMPNALTPTPLVNRQPADTKKKSRYMIGRP